MQKTSTFMRFAFIFAALLATLALGMHVSNWLRGAAFNWPVAINMFGLVLAMVVGAVDPPAGRLRMVLFFFIAALIFPSAIWLYLQS